MYVLCVFVTCTCYVYVCVLRVRVTCTPYYLHLVLLVSTTLNNSLQLIFVCTHFLGMTIKVAKVCFLNTALNIGVNDIERITICDTLILCDSRL